MVYIIVQMVNSISGALGVGGGDERAMTKLKDLKDWATQLLAHKRHLTPSNLCPRKRGINVVSLRVEVGAEWEGSITRCPICKEKRGYCKLDSWETHRCNYCGSRFILTIRGVQYVGKWGSYPCKALFSDPINEFN